MTRLLPLALAASLGHLTAQAPQPAAADGGRSMAVHRIEMRTAEGGKIAAGDDPLLPFSTRTTCGECHDYSRVRRGWHFNYADPNTRPGRPGEPWLLCDPGLGLQLPLSHRPWPGTWRPAALDLDDWLFARAFGAHLPGGGPAEPAADSPGANPRWFVAGRLEINCLHCHSADPAQDGSEWAVQVSRQNFLWAAAAASHLGEVTGSTAGLPDTFDPFLETNGETKGPRMRYDPARIGVDGKVLFPVLRRPDPSRCYTCHSFRESGPGALEKWEADEDVHLRAGLACTDCHRNGLDHDLRRGYEGETPDSSLTCRGCHLGTGHLTPMGTGHLTHANENPQTSKVRWPVPIGRLGAPRPRHLGLPAVHLERLACTACHSGPRPGERALLSQTSRSHRLGVHGGWRGEASAPYIYTPVLLHQDGDGPIAPHRVVWPSFWGWLAAGKVTPIGPFRLEEWVGKLLRGEGEAPEAPRGGLAKERVVAALAALAHRGGPGEPCFVSGGRLFRRDGEELQNEVHPAGQPYAWPLAHEVRPAAQSLGAGGCTDCHAPEAPFFFGRVVVATPDRLAPPRELTMHELRGEDPAPLRILGWGYRLRPWLKWGGLAVVALLLLILAQGLMAGLGGILRRGQP